MNKLRRIKIFTTLITINIIALLLFFEIPTPIKLILYILIGVSICFDLFLLLQKKTL